MVINHSNFFIHTCIFSFNFTGGLDSKNSVEILLPARQGFDEIDEIISCDKAFAAAVQAVVGSVEDMRNNTNALLAEHLNSARPTRSRKNTADAKE